MGWGSFLGVLGLQADQQSNAIARATDKQQAGLDRSTDIANQQFQQTRQDNMPALDARNASLDKMRMLLGIGGDKTASGYGSLGGAINPGDVSLEPGYKFGLDQGMRGLNNQLRAQGKAGGGSMIKAGTRYATDYASTKYGDAFNREIANRNQQLNPLSVLAGAGQVGASTIAQAGQNYASTAGNNAIQYGNVGAAKSMGSFNAWNNALNQGLSMGKQAMGGMYG